MRLKHLLAAMALLSTSALADEELKPAQEEAKTSFEESISSPLEATNAACGTKLTVKTDFQNFKPEEWDRTSHSSYCEEVLSGIRSMCERPAYKKAIAKKVTGVACVFEGVKPANKKEGNNDTVQRNISLEKGVLTYHMQVGHANISDNTKASLQKALN